MSVGLEADSAREAAFSRRFPVHRACRDGDVVALVSLFQRISDPPAQLTTEDSCCGWTPIHWAAHHGQVGKWNDEYTGSTDRQQLKMDGSASVVLSINETNYSHKFTRRA